MKDQFFADYLERLQDLQRRLHQEVRDLPAEAMDWSPGPKMNSVAVLLAHITGVLHEANGFARAAVEESLTVGDEPKARRQLGERRQGSEAIPEWSRAD